MNTDDIISLISEGVKALTSGQYGILVSALIGCLVWTLKRYSGLFGTKVQLFFNSDPGGVVLAFLTSLAVAIAGAGGAISGAILVASLKTAFVAIGGYTLIKKFIIPLGTSLFGLAFPNSVAEVKEKAALQSKTEVTNDAKTDLDAIK